jgi:A/G-specific adenine glycosylase
MSRTWAGRLLRWAARHGRRGLPWQDTRDPYCVWLSEIMLQQTQVATVIDYYTRFLARFPTVQRLAAAREQDVLGLWSGLGYYSRARHLHAAARQIVAEHAGRFPRAAADLARLPGIGPSTAAAIAAFCFDERAAIVDGNVKRVLARHFGIAGAPDLPAVHRALAAQADALLPARGADMGRYTQAIMDFGATVCMRRAPQCDACPMAATCVARRDGRVDTLPTPRMRRPAPLRRAQWLVLRAGSAVLLHERPARGLWGGLWTLPQFASRPQLTAAWPQAAAACRLPTQRHAFTHFTLQATPHLVDLPRRASAPPAHRWVRAADWAAAPLPAPVRRLLLSLPEPARGAGRTRAARSAAT